MNSQLIDPSIQKHIHHIHNGLEKISTLEYGKPGALGNYRWTADLLLSTWYQGSTGKPPENGLEYKVGNSGGGFDRLDFKFLPQNQWLSADTEFDLSLHLGKNSLGEEVRISMPTYGGGMSFGSISLHVILARAKAASELGTFTCTGEGGYPDPVAEYADHVITQVSTGMFGVSEETIQRAPIVEFKYAQGAKPGLGGHLLGDKNTTEVSVMREAVPWISLFQPFPFHSVYSVEDHKKHVDWIRQVNPTALVSVKVSSPTDVDMVAIGSYYADADIIHVDGGYGGTGAAPEIAKKNIALPIEYAIPKVHRYLLNEGVRDEITFMASGGIRTAYDAAKAIALGSDGCVIGAAELIAMGCTQCGNCERGRGCQVGLTTTDPFLTQILQPDWGAERIVNLYSSWKIQWREILRKLGLRSMKELRGRKDLLFYRGAA